MKHLVKTFLPCLETERNSIVTCQPVTQTAILKKTVN